MVFRIFFVAVTKMDKIILLYDTAAIYKLFLENCRDRYLDRQIKEINSRIYNLFWIYKKRKKRWQILLYKEVSFFFIISIIELIREA